MNNIYKRALNSVVRKFIAINPDDSESDNDTQPESKVNVVLDEDTKDFFKTNDKFNSIVRKAIEDVENYINGFMSKENKLINATNKLINTRDELINTRNELIESMTVEDELRNVEDDSMPVEDELRNVEDDSMNVKGELRNVEDKLRNVEEQITTIVNGFNEDILKILSAIWDTNEHLFNGSYYDEAAYVLHFMKGFFTKEDNKTNIDTLENYFINPMEYILNKKNLNDLNHLLKSLKGVKTEQIAEDSQTIIDDGEPINPFIRAHNTILQHSSDVAYLIQKTTYFDRHADYNPLQAKITGIFKQKQHSVKKALKNELWDPVKYPCDKHHWCIHNFINQATDLMHDVEKNGLYIDFLIVVLEDLIKQIEMSRECTYSKENLNKYKHFLDYLKKVHKGEQIITQTTLHKIRDTFFQIFINYPKLGVFKLNYKEPVPIKIEECYHEIMSEILNGFKDAFIYHESGRIPNYFKLIAFYRIEKNRIDFFEKYPKHKVNPLPDLIGILERKVTEYEKHIIQNPVSNFDAAPRTKKEDNTKINDDVYEIDDVLCKFKYTIKPFEKNNYWVIVYEEGNIIAEFSFKNGVPINMLLNHVRITPSRQGNGESGSINTVGETMKGLGFDLTEEPEKRRKGQDEGKKESGSARDILRNNKENDKCIIYTNNEDDPQLQDAKNQLLLFLNKTNGDTLCSLFDLYMKYIFTVDSLVAHSIYIRFIRNNEDHCPTIYRQIANGFIKYFGLEIIDADLKATQTLNKIISMYYFRKEIIRREEDKKTTTSQTTTSQTTALQITTSQPSEKKFHLDRITQILNVYEKYIPEIIETLIPNQNEKNPYRAIMLLLQIAEAEYIKTKLVQYNTGIQNLFDVFELDMDNFFTGIKTKDFDFFENVSTMPDFDYFEPRINKHAIIQEAHENYIIDNILQNIPVNSWELHFEEPNIHFIWVMGRVQEKDVHKINNLDTLSRHKKDLDNLDNVKYSYSPIDKVNKKHIVTIPITLDVLLQLYNHNHRSIINDQEKKKKIRENIDMMITTIVETSIKGYNQIDLVQERIKQLLDHIHTKGTSPVPLSISKTLHGNLSSAAQTFLSQANADQANAVQANADQAKAGQGITVVDDGTISPLDPKGFHRKGGSIQNSSKKRFNFRANTKNNYSALSKVISIKKNNKTKKSRKKKNKTKKFYKKKKNKRQTKKR